MGSRMPTDRTQENKFLFIAHLAARIESMDQGKTPIKPLTYRVHARRLHEAMAGCPDRQLEALMSEKFPCVTEVLASRFFDAHGFLPGPRAQTARALANEVLHRLRRTA